MASEKLFRDIPPFPDDLSCASVDTISLSKLSSGDETACKALLDGCQELGFFLLDLRGDSVGEAVIEEIDQLFAASKEIFNLPDSERQGYNMDPPKTFFGFKPRGLTKTETLQKDRYESLNISQDTILGNGPPQPLPAVAKAYLTLFTSFLQHGRTIISLIARTLAVQLSLAPDIFNALMRPDKPSGSQVRLLKADASPDADDMRTALVQHTDFGSITLLANVLGGLQILAPGRAPTDTSADAWLWIRPRPACLIVNLGDAMVQWTGGVLRSNMHRIYHAPGEQRFVDRYSLALLLRADSDASMRPLVGGSGQDDPDANLTAKEWETKKAMAMKNGTAFMQSKGGKPMAVTTH